MAGTTKVGVYFGMPDDEYRAIKALSQSGIRDYHVSPLDYWVNSPLNPNRPETDTRAQQEGRALHTIILEGTTAFRRQFSPAPVKANYPGALDTADELRKYATKIGGITIPRTKVGICEAITKMTDQHPPLFPLIEEKWRQALGDRTPLKAEFVDDAKRIGRAFHKNPYARELLKDTEREVVVVWTQDGVKCKARLDTLAPRRVTDLKFYTNTLNKPIDEAIAQIIASYMYHVQAVFYCAAYHAARDFIGVRNRVHGFTGNKCWLQAIQGTTGDPEFVFIFVSRGPAVNIDFRLLEYTGDDGNQMSTIWYDAWRKIDWVLGEYRRWKKSHPRRPWVVTEPPRALSELEFPQWGLQ